MKRIVLEIDGHAYAIRGKHWRRTTIDWSRMTRALPAEYVISDHGAAPRLREACGKKSYCEYVLARDLRDEGELTGRQVLLVDRKYVPRQDHCNILFHVADAEKHRLRLQALEDTNDAAVLLSFGKVLAHIGEAERHGTAVVVVMHHEAADLLLVRQGKLEALQRLRNIELPDADAAQPLAERMSIAVAQLERQSGCEATRIVFHHLLLTPAQRDAAQALARETTTGRGEPGTLAPLDTFQLDDAPMNSSMLATLNKVSSADACSSRGARLRRWSMENLGRAALLLIVANAACFTWWQEQVERLAVLDARHAALSTAPAVAEGTVREELRAVTSRISPSLEALAAIERASHLPSVSDAIAQLSAGVPGGSVRIDSMVLEYPDARVGHRDRNDAAIAPDALRVELRGQITAPALEAVGIYDRLVQGYESRGYVLGEGKVDTAVAQADFSLALELAPRE